MEFKLSQPRGQAILGKGQQRALAGLDNCRKRTPFEWKEFHPDNGTNLLNFAVYAYAEKEGLEFSRSRSKMAQKEVFGVMVK